MNTNVTPKPITPTIEAAIEAGLTIDPGNPEGKSIVEQLPGIAAQINAADPIKNTHPGYPTWFAKAHSDALAACGKSQETRRRMEYEIDKAQREYAGQKKNDCGHWECTRCGKDVSKVTHRCGCQESPSPWVPKKPTHSLHEAFDLHGNVIHTSRETTPDWVDENDHGQVSRFHQIWADIEANTTPEQRRLLSDWSDPRKVEARFWLGMTPDKVTIGKPTHQILGVDVQGSKMHTAKVTIPDWVDENSAPSVSRWEQSLRWHFHESIAALQGDKQKRRERWLWIFLAISVATSITLAALLVSSARTIETLGRAVREDTLTIDRLQNTQPGVF